jgi:hypothetical protein
MRTSGTQIFSTTEISDAVLRPRLLHAHRVEVHVQQFAPVLPRDAAPRAVPGVAFARFCPLIAFATPVSSPGRAQHQESRSAPLS